MNGWELGLFLYPWAILSLVSYKNGKNFNHEMNDDYKKYVLEFMFDCLHSINAHTPSLQLAS